MKDGYISNPSILFDDSVHQILPTFPTINIQTQPFPYFPLAIVTRLWAVTFVPWRKRLWTAKAGETVLTINETMMKAAMMNLVTGLEEYNIIAS